MLENTEFAHFTVPHSGTRYVNRAVENALGVKFWQCGSHAAHKRMERDGRANQTALFCHLGQRWDDWVQDCIEQPQIKTWITVRSPIHTWGTHFKALLDARDSNMTYQPAYEKLGNMRAAYESLIKFAPQVGYVHRVEDSLDGLSEYLGIELQEHDVTFSNPSPMKKALQERDVEMVEQLSSFCPDYWAAFRDYMTPDYREFFENLGYDIWWNNG